MVYLESFTLPDELMEHNVLSGQLNIYSGNYYPFGLLSYKQLTHIYFDNITIFYGGNGSGKTTLLNIIGEKVNASKENNNSKGILFEEYTDLCDVKYKNRYDFEEVKSISSDDVFDYLLDIRAINTGVNRKKAELADNYLHDLLSKDDEDGNFLENYEKLKRRVEARKFTKSKYIRTHLINNNIQEHSNGETALSFWQSQIKEDSIYILDEPENSLSAENQLKLKTYIEESARFYNCQFIISTHSPFLLSLNEALIYDLDENPVVTKKWNELKNVQVYYDFFKDNKDSFENKEEL